LLRNTGVTRGRKRVSLFIGNLKAVPDQVSRQKFDVGPSSPDHDPRVAGRNVQAGAGFKMGVVVPFERYPQSLLIIRGHVSVVSISPGRVKGLLPLFPALLKISISPRRTNRETPVDAGVGKSTNRLRHCHSSKILYKQNPKERRNKPW